MRPLTRVIQWGLHFLSHLFPGNGRRAVLHSVALAVPELIEWVLSKSEERGTKPMAGVVAMDLMVKRSMAWVIEQVLLGDAYLRLYQNDLTPTPANTVPADFQEADFGGYIPLPVASTFPPEVQVIAGRWRSRSAIQIWMPPATGMQTIYGWFITVGPEVIFAARFAAPIIMASDSLPLALTIDLESIARSLVPC